MITGTTMRLCSLYISLVFFRLRCLRDREYNLMYLTSTRGDQKEMYKWQTWPALTHSSYKMAVRNMRSVYNVHEYYNKTIWTWKPFHSIWPTCKVSGTSHTIETQVKPWHDTTVRWTIRDIFIHMISFPKKTEKLVYILYRKLHTQKIALKLDMYKKCSILVLFVRN